MRECVYPDNSPELDQPRQLLTLGLPAPEFPGGVVGGDVNCLEGEFVGLEDGLEAGGRGDDMGGSGG